MANEKSNPANEPKEEAAVSETAEEIAKKEEQAAEVTAEETVASEPAEDEAQEAVEADEAEKEEAAADDTEAEAVEDGEEAADDEAKIDAADDADVLPALGAENAVVPEKKQRSFGMGLGIGIGIAVLIGAIIGIIMLIAGASGPTSAVDEYIEAYKNAAYEDYFSSDYAVVYKYDNLEESIEQAKQYGDAASAADLQTKVIKTVVLSDEVKDSIKSQLEAAEYKDVDKIEDVNIVLLEVSRPSTTDDSKRDFWVSSFYALKVDGKWYFTTGF